MNTSDKIIVPFKISRENYMKITAIKVSCIADGDDFEELFNSSLSALLDGMLDHFEFLHK